jgi:hypothetical protein
MTPHDGKQADIPILKKRERERKGGAVVASPASSSSGGGVLYRWFGIGGGRAAQGASGIVRSGATAKVVSAPGMLPALINFTGSNAAMVLMTTALSAGAVYTLYTVGMSTAKKHEARQAQIFPGSGPQNAAVGTAGGDRAVEPSSLNYFMTANQGRAYEPESSDGEIPATADAPSEVDPEVVEEVIVEEEEGGTNTGLAEALTKAVKPKMVAAKGFRGGGQPLGSGNGLAGGTGMAGGMQRKFKDQKKQSAMAQAKSMSKPGRRKLARRTTPISRAGGKGPMNQLKFSNKKSVKSLGMTSNEGRAFEAANAFTTAPAGQGGSIGGGGVGLDSAGLDTGANSDGGPIGGGYTGTDPAPTTGTSSDKSPWTPQVMLAMSLLMTASTIITVIGILAMYKNIPFIGGFISGIQTMLFGVAAGMAGTATALGAMIMSQHGQPEQGMILTTGGAITTATAVASMMAPQSMPSWAVVLGGVAGIAASVGAMLSGMMGGGK